MIKAIETVYNGYRFRSRLEARWAVFFDTLGIKYEYEKEGYDLDGTWYLPDFWLPEQDFWVEIKGEEPTQGEWEKAYRLFELSGKEVFMLSGPIPNVNEDSDPDEFPQFSPISGDEQYMWCDCPDCGYVGIQWSGYSDRLRCKRCIPCFVIEHRKIHPTRIFGCWECDQVQGEWEKDSCPTHQIISLNGCPYHSLKLSKHPTYNSPRLIAAYTAARQARFEHGESGRR